MRERTRANENPKGNDEYEENKREEKNEQKLRKEMENENEKFQDAKLQNAKLENTKDSGYDFEHGKLESVIEQSGYFSDFFTVKSIDVTRNDTTTHIEVKERTQEIQHDLKIKDMIISSQEVEGEENPKKPFLDRSGDNVQSKGDSNTEKQINKESSLDLRKERTKEPEHKDISLPKIQKDSQGFKRIKIPEAKLTQMDMLTERGDFIPELPSFHLNEKVKERKETHKIEDKEKSDEEQSDTSTGNNSEENIKNVSNTNIIEESLWDALRKAILNYENSK